MGSSSLNLCLEGFVKVFIFLFRIMSQISYFDILDISIRTDIIFSFLEYVVFSSSCLITIFRKCYSSLLLIFCWKVYKVCEMISEERESVKSPIFFSYLWRGSSLKREETIFIVSGCFYIIILMAETIESKY